MCGIAALTKKRQSTTSTYYVFVATCCFLFGFCGNLHTWTDSLLSVEIVHFLLLVFYKYSSNYAQKGSQHLLRLNLSPSLSSRKLNSPAFFPCGVPHIVDILCSRYYIPIVLSTATALSCACSRTEFPPAVKVMHSLGDVKKWEIVSGQEFKNFWVQLYVHTFFESTIYLAQLMKMKNIFPTNSG